MACVFVAKSDSLQGWASDRGLTMHVYKLGLAEGSAADAIAMLNETAHAGRSDWQLLAEQETTVSDEAAILARAAGKETLVDPTYYPQIKRAPGIFKVKLTNVENHFLVREALEGQQIKKIRITPGHVGTYLIRVALG